MYLLLNFPLPRCVSLWVVPTVSAATFVLLRAFLSWHHWVMENKNQQAAAALRHGVHCSQMAFSLWRRRLAQKVEADRRFRCHVQQMTADALRHWHSCWQSELPHPSASLVSVEEKLWEWDGQSHTFGCVSVHCSSGKAHASPGVSMCHCFLLAISRTCPTVL